jgi:hypothetical protein
MMVIVVSLAWEAFFAIQSQAVGRLHTVEVTGSNPVLPTRPEAASGTIFPPVGTPATLSIDLVAEALLNGEGFATFASGVSEWDVTGGFSITGAANAQAAESVVRLGRSQGTGPGPSDVSYGSHLTLARFAGRGYPCPIAGRSRMPSWHPLTQTGPRFGILPSCRRAVVDGG